MPSREATNLEIVRACLVAVERMATGELAVPFGRIGAGTPSGPAARRGLPSAASLFEAP